MSIFDIILGVGLLGLLAVMILAADGFIKDIKDIRETLDNLNDRIEYTRELLDTHNSNLKDKLDGIYKNIGYDELFNDYRGYVCTAPSESVHERINLLMDHLNLEIKEGEPSKTVLVKKTTNKGK